MRIVHIEASPRHGRSSSSQTAREFLRQVSALNPSAEVDHLDVWSEPLPAFDGAALDAKYAKLADMPLTASQEESWQTLTGLVARLNRADAVLVSTPMWNFGVPYRLKHFIDLVTQPDLTFRFKPGVGYTALLAPRPTVVILASSGDYSTGESYGRPDLASGYLRAALRFIGLDNASVVPVAPTAGPPDQVKAGRQRAALQLEQLAPQFAGVAP